GTTPNNIRIPLSTSSIAGYVALSQKSLRIDDVSNDKALSAVHPKLKFNHHFDKLSGFNTKAMVATPIKKGQVVIGILQLINQTDEGIFVDNDMLKAEELANVIAKKFSKDSNATKGPFDYLLHNNQVTLKQLKDFDERARKQKTTITSLLMTEARISKDEIGLSLEKYFQIPFMSFDPNIHLPTELCQNLNTAYLKKQGWIPISGNQEEAIILIDNPSDYSRIMEMERVLDVDKIILRIGLIDDIYQYINSLTETSEEHLLDDLIDQLTIDESNIVEEHKEESINDHAIVQLVNQVITDAYNANASDIHVEPGKEKQATSVRIRVDGLCRALLDLPYHRAKEVIARIKVMAGMDISERRKPQDGKLKVKIKGQTVELRVATIPTVNGECAVLRILASGGALPLEKLNLSPENLKNVEKLTEHPHGLILVVGPTGSGKTTTLHGVLNKLNRVDRKIWTAEDPVEITQPGLQQVQISRKSGFTFADAMRSFLRADPDIILIGEMRDKETSHIGIEASLTGHLVLSTLHTNSAPETITRLLDLDLDPMSFSDALLGVLAQRLMRTLCKSCKQAYQPPQQEIDYLRRQYDPDNPESLQIDTTNLTLYRAKGCEHCGDTGYSGRTGIHELLMVDDEMRKLIYNKSSVALIKKHAIKSGMKTLLQDGIIKLLNGETDIQQLHRVVAE
ncbi:MAG: Flp pilus assembly complex ATPase component TadA, partial [Methylococcales bacterium]|nr:Flp pilus assembly complex ATPase component TadA [Methylococcales bacterium]